MLRLKRYNGVLNVRTQTRSVRDSTTMGLTSWNPIKPEENPRTRPEPGSLHAWKRALRPNGSRKLHREFPRWTCRPLPLACLADGLASNYHLQQRYLLRRIKKVWWTCIILHRIKRGIFWRTSDSSKSGRTNHNFPFSQTNDQTAKETKGPSSHNIGYTIADMEHCGHIIKAVNYGH